MFFGLRCTKRLLVAINIAYIGIAATLIVLGYYYSGYVTDLPLVIGISACGVLLFALAILGLIATYRQYRMCLFVYMITLIIVFFIQLSISAACIAVDKERTQQIVKESWAGKNDLIPFDYIRIAEIYGRCCGYDEDDPSRHPENIERNSTDYFKLLFCLDVVENCANTTYLKRNGNRATNLISMKDRIETVHRLTHYDAATILPPITPDELLCPPCKEVLEDTANRIFNGVGAIGLGLAFIEILPIVVAYKQWKSIATNDESIALTSVR